MSSAKKRMTIQRVKVEADHEKQQRILAQHHYDVIAALAKRVAEENTRLREALEIIKSRGLYPVNDGMACATCTTFWGAYSKWQSEHHMDRCAYVIACAALAKNPVGENDVEGRSAGPRPEERGASPQHRPDAGALTVVTAGETAFYREHFKALYGFDPDERLDVPAEQQSSTLHGK